MGTEFVTGRSLEIKLWLVCSIKKNKSRNFLPGTTCKELEFVAPQLRDGSVTAKVHGDKWPSPTFVPEIGCESPLSTRGDELSRSGRRVSAGRDQRPWPLTAVDFFLRTCCDPNSVLAIVVSSPRSRSHVSQQTLAPFAIWELEHHIFSALSPLFIFVFLFKAQMKS